MEYLALYKGKGREELMNLLNSVDGLLRAHYLNYSEPALAISDLQILC